jgi:geranylgeranyl diphosphate synthase type I
MAICGGDMCMFLALRLLAGAPPTVNRLFGDILVEVCDGQMQDIYTQSQQDIPSKQAIYNLMRSKTASYTLSLPLALGAAMADRPPDTIKKLRRIGDAAGTIFQIRDDELGVMGDSDKTGKPVGADIREGKKTLIYYYLMKSCGIVERRKLRATFGSRAVGAEDIAIIRQLIRKYDVRRLINADVQRLEKQGTRIIETLDISHRRKTELRSFMDFCTQRHA